MNKFTETEDYKKIGSLHDYRDWEDKVTHGEWVKPVWSRVQTMVGSIPTPYIIDDKVDVQEVSDAQLDIGMINQEKKEKKKD